MRNKGAKMIALVLAILMAATMIIPLISLLARAATLVLVPANSINNSIVINNHVSGSQVDLLSPGRIDIEFEAIVNLGSVIPSLGPNPPFTAAQFDVAPASAWSNSSGTLNIEFKAWEPSASRWLVDISISDITYVRRPQNDLLRIYVTIPTVSHGNHPVIFDVTIPSRFFQTIPDNGNGNNIPPNNNDPSRFISRISVESVIAHDRNGRAIRDITRDTEPFSIQITFADLGLINVHRDDFDRNYLNVFLTNPGSLIPLGATRGNLRTLSFRAGDPPRFVATFNNLTYAGSVSHFAELAFLAQYSILGEQVFGEGAARFFGIVSDDEDDTQPFTPYVILTEHGFGADQVVAGSTFTLNMTFANTSNDIDLSNIVMVITPVSTEQQQSFLSIASATNTYFFESMPARGQRSQNVDFLVMQGAPAGSQAVSVEFRYEYLVSGSPVRQTFSTTIHIPIIQVDRFAVDPITDFSQWMQLGDEGYVVVSFVNLGRSTILNVSGFILDAEGNQGQTERHGNLEAGASGNLDFSFSPQQAGEFTSAIVIQYENEAGEEMQVETTFSSFVEEPWFPPPPDRDVNMFEPERTGAPWWRYLLLIAGGLGIGAPLALYIIKRVKAKGNEEFDEDF